MSALPALDTLTLEEKVGQLFQVGFSGRELSTNLHELITEYHVGGVIYFSRNAGSIAETAALSEELQNIASVAPLLITADEEGGSVRRLQDGVHLPSQMAIAATGEPENARACGVVTGKQLRAAGINMNLSPVLDVNTDPENPVIGSRAYGDDPGTVGEFGSAYIEGLQAQGVSACGKHFPGHGDTTRDSHLGLPVVDHDRRRLAEIELPPFRAAIEHRIDCLMTAHVSFPEIEPDPQRPATLSSAVLTDLLRSDLGFTGLIITDCLEMKAIDDRVGTSEGAIQAIDAGADIVLISHTPAKQRAAIEAVVAAVEDGRLAAHDIDTSVRRIFDLKERRALETSGGMTADPDAARAIADRIALSAVTVVRDQGNTLPLDGNEVTVVRSHDPDRTAVAEPQTEGWEVAFEERLRSHEMAVRDIETPSGDGDSIPSNRPVIVLCQDATADPSQQATVAELASTVEELVILAVWNPYDIQVLPTDTTYLTCFDQSPACLRAAADVITGNAAARGVLPVTLRTGAGEG